MNKTSRPRVFVASASSSEGLSVAEQVKAGLLEWADCSLWKDQDIFQASSVIIESLERALELFPYAVFVLSPEDSTIIRDQRHLTPRDNLVFELGLFAGRYGRRSVFLLIPRDFKLRLPTDLDGVITCHYERRYGSGGTAYDVSAACEEMRRRIAEIEGARPSAWSSRFWDVLSDEIVLLFGLEQSPDDPLGTHPRVSLRDLEAAHALATFLGRRYPRKRVLMFPASSPDWHRLLPALADLIVVGGWVSNIEFARHRDAYQRHFRLKMGRLCRIEGQRVFHPEFARLPPGMRKPDRSSPEELARFPSEHVSRDFALIFSRRLEVYGAQRRVLALAGIKGNGTRAAARFLTEREPWDHRLDSLLGRPLVASDELELVLAVDLVHDVIDRTELVQAVLNGECRFDGGDRLWEPCELERPCRGCDLGEEPVAGRFAAAAREGAASATAIIFDLDDTIVDTTSLLIAPLEIEAAKRMVEAGAPFESAALAGVLLGLRRDRPDRLEEELSSLLAMTAPGALAARRSVLASVPAERLYLDPEVELFLREIAEEHDLFLLTEGDPSLQQRKIDHLGIRGLFRDVLVVPSGTETDKEAAITAVLERWCLDPRSTMIVGNRLDKEIRAGSRLGLTTVWVRHGEGAGLPLEDPAPHHVLASLPALRSLFYR